MTAVAARTGPAVAAGARRALGAVPWWAWLGLLFLCSVAVRFALARRDPGPWIFVDELIYSELGKSVAADRALAIRGVPSGGYGSVYPVLIAPAYALFDDLPRAFAAIKLINAVLMSSTCIPAYFLARRLMSPRPALLAAVLAVAVPGMTYTGVVMTENVFYPLTVTAALAMVLALERPTLLRQALVLIVLVLAFMTRVQAVALVVAYPAAILAYGWLECRARRASRSPRAIARELARWWASWALLVAGVVVVVALQVARDRPLRDVFGAYAVTADGDRIEIRTVLRWFVYHVAELDLWLGVIPFAAFLVVLVAAFDRVSGRGAVRAFVAVSVPVVVALTVVVSMFNASIANTRIEERNLFHVGVFPLIALAWWAAHGLPRPRGRTIVAAGASAALVGVIPFGALINISATSDTFGLLPLWTLQEKAGLAADELVALVVVVCVVAAALAAAMPRRLAVALPLLVLATFAAAHTAVEGRTNGFSAATYGEGIRTASNWIDAAVGRDADVAALWAGAPTPLVVWQNEFFNRSVGRVYSLGSPLPGALPETPVALDPASGELRDAAGVPVTADYVLVERSLRLAGERVAEDAGRGMELVAPAGVVRLEDQVAGVFGDAWSGPEATYTRFACTGGQLDVVLASDASLFPTPQTVTAYAGEAAIATITVAAADGNTVASIPLAPVAGACTVRFVVTPTAVPAQVLGTPDTRALGVRFLSFVFSPAS